MRDLSPRPYRVLLSHPGCGPFVQQAARALYEAGLLATYATSFDYRPASVTGRALHYTLGLVSSEMADQLGRRQVREVPSDVVALHPIPEMLRMATVKFRLGRVAADVVWEQTELLFDRIVARRHIAGTDAVYGYDHAALCSFQAQRERGGLCIYEMPQAHHATVSAMLGPEFERFPELRTTYVRHTRRQDARRNARRDQEIQLAHRIVVNSTFSQDSLIRAGIEAHRITVVPLGSPPVAQAEPTHGRGPFVFLSAGAQSVRKGVHYLLEAWRLVGATKGAELWLVGGMQLPARVLRNLPGTVVVRPSLPSQDLFRLYKKADVLVFPSLCEGFGMVITEAMAHGLPAITTPHTAGRDLIASGKNGLIVPVRDAESLAAAMQWCLDHPDAVRDMGRQALVTASRWQWPDYRAALATAVGELLRGHVPGRVGR